MIMVIKRSDQHQKMRSKVQVTSHNEDDDRLRMVVKSPSEHHVQHQLHDVQLKDLHIRGCQNARHPSTSNHHSDYETPNELNCYKPPGLSSGRSYTNHGRRLCDPSHQQFKSSSFQRQNNAYQSRKCLHSNTLSSSFWPLYFILCHLILVSAALNNNTTTTAPKSRGSAGVGSAAALTASNSQSAVGIAHAVGSGASGHRQPSAAAITASSPSSSSSSQLANNDQLYPTILASYTTYNESVNFTRIAVDQQSSRIYVGATNSLYQFQGPQLKLEFDEQTGPVLDSVFCSPANCEDDGHLIKSAKLTNTINKLLVVDHHQGQLIVCGSVHQGSCRRHKLNNITSKEDLVPIPVAANDDSSSTYAFIGPARYFGNHLSPVLYVAATFTRLGPYRELVPAIASRSLESGHNLFTIIETSFSSTAKVDINFHMRDYYLVNYVYGFSSSDFVYFATVQRRSHLRHFEETGFATRLARICQADSAYKTYTEITLQCFSRDGRVNYNLLQDAEVVPANPAMAADLNVPVGHDVLVGVFSVAKDLHSSLPSNRSAICMYSVAAIEAKFNENLQACFNGSLATRNMDYIAGNLEECPRPGTGGNVPSFCNETLKINGSYPIKGRAVVTYDNAILTAVTAVTKTKTKDTLLFVGTGNGYLKKMMLIGARIAQEVDEIEVDHGNPILADMFTDKYYRYIIAASPYKLVTVSIGTSLKQGPKPTRGNWVPPSNPTGTSSGSSGHPSGGSNGTYHPSSVNVSPSASSILRGIHNDRQKWLYSNVYLEDVYPKIGPKSGGTRLYLTGANLNTGAEVHVFLDNLPCRVEWALTSSRQMSCITTRAPTENYKVSKLTLKIDGAVFTLPNPFTYVPDPTITRIYPLESFLSGGRTLTVVGTNFTSIRHPRIAVFNYLTQIPLNESKCEVVNDTLMLCQSPPVSEGIFLDGYPNVGQGPTTRMTPMVQPTHGSNSLQQQFGEFMRDASLPSMKLRIGFVMDEVKAVKDIGRAFPSVQSALIYVPDPKLYHFPEDGVKVYRGDPLVIDGEHLRLAASEDDVQVWIADQPCNITSLTNTQIVCNPPAESPAPTDEKGYRTFNDLPLVTVLIGANVRHEIGFLKYEAFSSQSAASSSTTSTVLTALLAIVIVILVAITLVALVIGLLGWGKKSMLRHKGGTPGVGSDLQGSGWTPPLVYPRTISGPGFQPVPSWTAKFSKIELSPRSGPRPHHHTLGGPHRGSPGLMCPEVPLFCDNNRAKSIINTSTLSGHNNHNHSFNHQNINHQLNHSNQYEDNCYGSSSSHFEPLYNTLDRRRMNDGEDSSGGGGVCRSTSAHQAANKGQQSQNAMDTILYEEIVYGSGQGLANSRTLYGSKRGPPAPMHHHGTTLNHAGQQSKALNGLGTSSSSSGSGSGSDSAFSSSRSHHNQLPQLSFPLQFPVPLAALAPPTIPSSTPLTPANSSHAAALAAARQSTMGHNNNINLHSQWDSRD